MAAAGPAKATPWSLNTRKLFKIWFNSDPTIFMGLENQERLKKWSQQNPKAALSLLYCRKLLTERAWNDLNSFCKQWRIQPIEISELKSQLKTPEDKTLFKLGMKEVICPVGSSFAAASDCFRTLVPVLEKCGIYSDCDVELDLSSKDQQVELKSSLVFETALVKRISDNIIQLTVNNEIVAAATLADGSLHPDAIKELTTLKRHIIKHYSQHPVDVLMPLAQKEINSPLLVPFLQQFKKDFPSGDIFTLRAYAMQCRLTVDDAPSDISLQQIQEIITSSNILMENILMLSVADFTGPSCYEVLFNRDLRSLLNCNLRSNGLDDCVISGNNPESNVKTGGDKAWLPSGEAKVMAREKELLARFERERRAAVAPPNPSAAEAAACASTLEHEFSSLRM